MRASTDRITTRCLIAFVLVWLVAGPASALAQVMYTIQDLGIGVSDATIVDPIRLAINAAGQVAGSSGTNQRAFRTTATGVISDPGADLGAFNSAFSQSFGLAINNSGQVTGFSAASDGFYHMFRTTPTGNLSDPSADVGIGFAFGINGSGQLTGDGGIRSSPNGQPFSLTQLGNLGGSGSAGYGINDTGQVTGFSNTASGVRHAFRTSSAGLISDPGADLGTLSNGTESRGYAINASGQVTGFSINAFGSSHAFRTTALGALTSAADLGAGVGYGINTFGVVVGTSGGHHAFVADSQMRDLNTLLVNGSGWVLTNAYGINDVGQIVGVATFGGQEHAFRLTPAPVPEPSALVLLGVAAVGGMVARRRQRRASRGGFPFSKE